MLCESDGIEFCLLMTEDKHGGLNPKSGIKVYPFEFRRCSNVVYEGIQNDYKELIEDIKRDIQNGSK